MISKLKHMYCISIDNRIFNKISELGYIPVGLGDSHFSPEWMTDKTGENISIKNKFYGEYTFHYFFWKNLMHKIPDQEWIGFCGYRRFWKNENNLSNEFKHNVLKIIPEKWNNFEVIIGDKLDLKIIKWIKVLKYGKIALARNPKVLINKNFRNIRFHFDMFHGNGVLDKAIDQLNHEDKIDFGEYVRINTSFNQGNMFITKSKKIMDNYYTILFEWLTRCEKIFGLNLYGYEKTRLYAFLAERFLSYWFKKNTNYLEWPVLFYDLSNEN
tara:strand:- start:2678 stop:3487 length:810 start_codon:yes stop_codon:yes gene_type:complete